MALEKGIFSDEVIRILKSGIGFRNEAYTSIENNYTLGEILHYEIKEQGNTDIIDTLREKWGITLDLRCRLDSRIRTILRYIADCFEVEDASTLRVVWLCADVADVCKYYCPPNKEQQLRKWIFDGTILCISDLGSRGGLFVYNDKDGSRVDIYPIG